MSANFEFVTTQVARKGYWCDASRIVLEAGDFGAMTRADLRLLAKARRDGWKIKKGQIYVKCSGIVDGEWTTFRARPEINSLCECYGLYE
jgi:hypothetical protein